MTRSPSVLAQLSFSASNKLESLRSQPSRAARLFARAAGRVIAPLAKKLGSHHTVTARLYDHNLAMPAEHFLPGILRTFPQFNRPLSLAVETIALANPRNLSVIDVGANIGDSAASIECRLPNRCFFLCLEPDSDLAELCELNHAGNDRVEVKRCYIGEDEGAPVYLKDDGRANPSTKSGGGNSSDHLVRLDTVADLFTAARGLDLIKTDTEGYDFSVLRSASKLLSKYKPAVYFEWSPHLLEAANERIVSGFDHLAGFGYRHFVFFTSQGEFYCKISDPDDLFLRSLASITVKNPYMEYFDVCASADEAMCNQLTEISIRYGTLESSVLSDGEPQLPAVKVKESLKFR
jgi:FkbM family methyltransferase